MEQTTEEPIDTAGIQIIIVSNLKMAWNIVSGLAPWQVAISK
jgi:hypothetical protein